MLFCSDEFWGLKTISQKQVWTLIYEPSPSLSNPNWWAMLWIQFIIISYCQDLNLIYIYTLSMLVGQKKWPIAFEFYNGTQSLPFTRANLLFRLRRSFSGTIPKGPGRIDIYSIPPWQTSRPSDFQGIQSSHISEECGQYIWNGLCIGSDGLRSVFPKRINFGFDVANPRINLPFGDGL